MIGGTSNSAECIGWFLEHHKAPTARPEPEAARDLDDVKEPHGWAEWYEFITRARERQR